MINIKALIDLISALLQKIEKRSECTSMSKKPNTYIHINTIKRSASKESMPAASSPLIDTH